MSLDEMDELRDLLAGRTAWLATGTVLEVRAGAVVVELDVAREDLVEAAADPDRLILAAPSEEPLAPGAHVLVEYAEDRRLVHGTVPPDVRFPVSYGGPG
jgi:hypothetical protein